jgi:hypothetical protein
MPVAVRCSASVRVSVLRAVAAVRGASFASRKAPAAAFRSVTSAGVMPKSAPSERANGVGVGDEGFSRFGETRRRHPANVFGTRADTSEKHVVAFFFGISRKKIGDFEEEMRQRILRAFPGALNPADRKLLAANRSHDGFVEASQRRHRSLKSKVEGHDVGRPEADALHGEKHVEPPVLRCVHNKRFKVKKNGVFTSRPFNGCSIRS